MILGPQFKGKIWEWEYANVQRNRSAYTPPTNIVIDSNTVGCWRMNDAVGSGIVDYSTNSFTTGLVTPYSWFVTNGIAQGYDLVDWYSENGTNLGGVDPSGALQSNGLRAQLGTKTTYYAMNRNDHIILADGTSASFTVTLPAANAVTAFSQLVTVKKLDSSANAIVVSGNGSDLIEGVKSKSLASQYNSLTLFSDESSKWYIQAST
jgi:hypothetical protein